MLLNRKFLLFFSISASLISNFTNSFEVKLNTIGGGKNFAATISLGGVAYYNVLIDSGNAGLTINIPTYNRTVKGCVLQTVSKFPSCLSLSEDVTDVITFSNSRGGCPLYNTQYITLGDHVYTLPTNFSVSTKLQGYDTYLHDWDLVNGDIGLGYCSEYPSRDCASPLTALQRIIANAQNATIYSRMSGSSYIRSSKPLTFGLDFNSPNKESTLQLGSLKAEYASKVSWVVQPVDNPDYHNIFLENLNICGVNLLAKWSNNWPVLIDTGSVCVTLPAEVYDVLRTWIKTLNRIPSPRDLPSLQFQLAGQADVFHIPLGDLLIPNSRLGKNSTAIPVTVGNSTEAKEMRICVLRGLNIELINLGATRKYPSIIFGSLALRSLYFAADFAMPGRVGLANKISSADRSYYSNASAANEACAAPVSCIGDQKFEYHSNTCTEPACKQYFFVSLNVNSQICEYRLDYISFGLLLIVLTTLAEVVSFFLTQYTAKSFSASERGRLLGRQRGTNLRNIEPLGTTATVESASAYIGSLIASILDPVIRYVCRSAPPVPRFRQ